MSTVIKNRKQLTEFAEKLYLEQKDYFVESFTMHLENRINSWLAQFENGEYMSLEEFKSKFTKEYLNK